MKVLVPGGTGFITLNACLHTMFPTRRQENNATQLTKDVNAR